MSEPNPLWTSLFHRLKDDGETHPAPALDYDAFRRIADWSAGMVDEIVLFHYGPEGQMSTDASSAAPELQVPAATVDRLRRVASLRMEAEGGELELVGHSDAAFWSEAAVEKFMVPYYASLGAGRAAVVTAQLMGVWGGNPELADGVEVVALTHYAVPPHAGAMSATDTLAVVYVESPGGVPQRLTLTDFMARFRPDLMGETITVPNARPKDPLELPQPAWNLPLEPGLPDYLELRVMAEWSSSLRGAPAYFVYDTKTGPDALDPYTCFHPTREVPTDTDGCIVIPTFTEKLVPSRPPVRSMVIQSMEKGSLPQELAQKADAVFWSSGSIEHLLMPYYAQVYGSQALRQIAAIHDVWWQNAPSSTPFRAGDGPRVYALLHLPNSDWTTVDPDPEMSYSVYDITGVVYATSDSPETAKVATLRDFLARHG